MSDPDPPSGPYDPQETPEEELWFLPAPPEEEGVPLPRAPQVGPFDAAGWAAAERACLPELIEATSLLARLEERLEAAPEGALERLALREVTDLMRHDRGWLGAERLALYRVLRAATGEDAQALARADWALRRLLAPPAPVTDLGGFLGLNRDEITPHPAWLLAPLEADLQPLTRMAALYAGARGEGGWDEAILEPLILASAAARPARLAPVGLAHDLRRTGPPELRLRAFCAGVTRSATAALLHLRQIRDWQARATRETRDLSGRIPGQLILALLAVPVLSVPMAAAATGASRAACQRNLALFEARGLIRETTGQGRYRFWALSAEGAV